MRIIFLALIAALLSAHDDVIACSIINQEKTQVGVHTGITGICSNNNMPVTCILMEGVGVECDGPSGGYTGRNLEALIFSACGCSSDYESEKQLKRKLMGD